MMKKKPVFLAFIMLLWGASQMHTKAQKVAVGSASYTTAFPAPWVAGRREQPRGIQTGTLAIPKVHSRLANKPVPTNDWWSTLVWTTANSSSHGWAFYGYPLSYRSRPEGLAMEYTVAASQERNYKQPMSAVYPIVVGVTGLQTSQSQVYDHSDWTVTASWTEGNHGFKSTIGLAMPFTYFEKKASEIAQIKLNFPPGKVTIQNEVVVIQNSFNQANFIVYGPTGTQWSQTGNVLQSNLQGKTYWSVVHVPVGKDPHQWVDFYRPYAYVFPQNTESSFSYSEQTSKVTTTFKVTPDIKEGTANQVLQGLLPHQWENLTLAHPAFTEATYRSVRGQLKTIAANEFVVENTFTGILPTLPHLAPGNQGFDASKLAQFIEQEKSTILHPWTDSYNEGKKMNRLAQIIRIAEQIGNEEVKNKLLAELKTRLEDWLTVETGETDFLFYYENTWGTLLAYPAAHGQDYNINDHHFHWGYFIHMAVLLEQYEPGWAAQWGDMINLLVRDAASTNRNDALFPYLRNFSPFAGHSWANGSGTFPDGNDQESSSESMQFHSSIIHWGEITGNKAIRDLGIYLYTTEQSAIEEYYWDIHNRVFQPELKYKAVSRIWGTGYDAYTFWTQDPSPVWGINFLPIHGGSLYLGHRPWLVKRLWDDITTHTGILNQEVNPNLWYDIYWMYLAFYDASEAIRLYNEHPSHPEEFGESRAHTYHWLHNMNALGQVDASITANYPIAAVFKKGNKTTHVAHNYGNTSRTVTFSDGTQLIVPPRQMITSQSGSSGDNEVPSTPEITSTNVTDSSITLNWSASQDNVGVTGYEVWLNGVKQVNVTTSNTTIQGLQANTTYQLAVRAYDKASNFSNFSSTKSVKTASTSQGGNNCQGSHGYTSPGVIDFSYEVSLSGTQPKIHFSPQRSGVAQITIIVVINGAGFYMQPTSNGTYTHTVSNVSANTAFSFYFVYSVPEGGERNNLASPFTCGGSSTSTQIASETNLNCKIYPMPANEVLNIQVQGKTIEAVTISSLMGKTVKSFTKDKVSLNSIDVADIPKGLYRIKIIVEGKTIISKVLIE